jgi:uncharacterized protein
MYLKRKESLDKIKLYINKPFIKVLTGLRRSGKTTIMNQLFDLFPKDKILYINKESKQWDDLFDEESLYQYLIKQIKSGKKYIFVDEIQIIKNWEKAILSIFTEYPSIEIFITWSNSSLLSSDLTTLLRGRYIQISVFPFSYEEFCEFYNLDLSLSSFERYIWEWWLPSLYHLDTQEQKNERSKNLINTIFLRDIVERYSIKDVWLLTELFYFIVNNIGNITNLSTILRYLKSKNIKSNVNTLESYLSYLKNSYLVYDVSLYNLQWKSVFQRERKLYIADHLFRKVIFGWFDQWLWKILENIVYINSVRKWYVVFVGKFNDKEIDFVLEKEWKKIYLQVTYILSDQKVIDREFWNLKLIKDNYPKYVLSMDNISIWNVDGIKHIPIWELETIL